MKKLVLTIMIAILLITNLFGQITATYDEVVSKKKTGDIEKYITLNNEEYKIGDTIILGNSFRNEQYDYIYQNAVIEYYPLTNIASNSRVVIKNIKIKSKLVRVNTTKAQGFVYGLLIINFEGALLNGEIKSKKMTSDQALEELKKYKNKLDLKIISEEEYNLKKEELLKFIK